MKCNLNSFIFCQKIVCLLIQSDVCDIPVSLLGIHSHVKHFPGRVSEYGTAPCQNTLTEKYGWGGAFAIN